MQKSQISRRSFIRGAGLTGLGVAGMGLAGCTTTGSDATADSAGDGTGEYLGIADGRNGAVVVKVGLDADRITSLEIVSEDESPNVGAIPVETFPALILENQSLDIDTVSGATISSMAIINAVGNALEQAGKSASDFAGTVSPEILHEDTTADVVVIGSGGAGLTASIKAAEAGKKVILLEKLGLVGGTSNFSIESYGSVGDNIHTGLGSPMTAADLAASFEKSYPKGRADALTLFAQSNGQGANWLFNLGAQLKLAGNQNSVATHREVGEFGIAIVATLHNECDKLGVDIRVNSPASEIVSEGGAITGVKVTTTAGDYTIATKAVIITAGGFGANNEMVTEYYPSLKGYNYSCSRGAAGDAHLMAKSLGADLQNMDYIRVNFSYVTAPNGYFYYTGGLFNTGAIFVNDDGKRFINEGSGYGVGLQVVDQGGEGWALFDNSIATAVFDARHWKKLGLYESADTLEELFDKIGINKANALATIDTYKGYVENGKDEEFGRTNLTVAFDEPPFYACKHTARVQGTFGGINVNNSAEVLDANGQAISGLFAAGECANDGTWGANPASVNVVFGGIAGESAAAFVG